MVDWLIGWLVGWLIGWLVGWLIGWLVCWLIGWLVDLCFTRLGMSEAEPFSLPFPEVYSNIVLNCCHHFGGSFRQDGTESISTRCLTPSFELVIM